MNETKKYMIKLANGDTLYVIQYSWRTAIEFDDRTTYVWSIDPSKIIIKGKEFHFFMLDNINEWKTIKNCVSIRPMVNM